MHRHHEFHVSSSRGFSTSSRDLFAKVSCRNNFLCQGDTVIFQVDNLQFIADDGIAVDHLTDWANQLNDLLGHMIARSSLNKRHQAFQCTFCSDSTSLIIYLSTNHDCPGYNWCSGIRFDTVVECNNMQSIHKLTFVLVNTFNLRIQKIVGLTYSSISRNSTVPECQTGKLDWRSLRTPFGGTEQPSSYFPV